MKKADLSYTIRRADRAPELDGGWTGAGWRKAGTARIEHFHPASSAHRPQAEAKVLYDRTGLYVSFRVKDRYVRAVARKHQDAVCKDSCVEFFVQPKRAAGYMNFEVNCGGTALIYYIEDAERTPAGFRKFTQVPAAMFRKLKIYHSLPKRIPDVITTGTVWQVALFIPFSFIETYVGPLGPGSGQTWRGNFFKCGDETTKPHWASWSPIGTKLNFHQPGKFAGLVFESEKAD